MVLELSLGVGDGVNEAVKVALEEAAEDQSMKQASHGRKWARHNVPHPPSQIQPCRAASIPALVLS